MRKILTFLLLLTACGAAAERGNGAGNALNDVTYTRQDSLKVTELLASGLKERPQNLMLYYGMRLRGVPYVAHTLEVNSRERLVVNLREMDCTTFVETVLALTLATKHGSKRWEDYCKWLETIRYRDGKRKGYTSRNHYFLWWTDSNMRLGIVETPHNGAFERQVININYMSTHSQAYKMLKGRKADIAAIARMERESKGRVMRYIPAEKTGMDREMMQYRDESGRTRCYVEDGDILAIATKKAGLDTSHIGIAKWGKDGKLHLLNASQIHKKVVLEPMTLYEYMKKHPTQLGVWVLRVR